MVPVPHRCSALLSALTAKQVETRGEMSGPPEFVAHQSVDLLTSLVPTCPTFLAVGDAHTLCRSGRQTCQEMCSWRGFLDD